jgi:surface polysaccharide O-acyltransferase-like enzyme
MSTSLLERSSVSEVAVVHHQRISGVEWLRYIASISIVWFHADAPGMSVAYAGLPVFMALSTLFAYRPTHRDWPVTFLTNRARRYLLPWICWSAIYLGLSRFSRHPKPITLTRILLVGGNLHLWYLPYAFIITAIVEYLSKVVTIRSPALVSGALGIFAGICIPLCSLTLMLPSTRAEPLHQWIFALPAVPLGLASIFLLRSGMHARLAYLWIAGVELVSCVLTWRGVGIELAVPYAVASIGIFIAFLPNHAMRDVLGCRAGECAFGIYLIHPMILGGVCRLFGISHGALVGGVTICVATATVFLLRKSPLKLIL